MSAGDPSEVLPSGNIAPPAAPPPASPGVRWVLALVVFLASMAPFIPSLSQGFVALDDDYNFERNEVYRELGAENIKWMFTEGYMGHYQPLSWLTLAVDYQLYGLDGSGYHLTNMLFHGLGMLALYFLAVALMRLSFPAVADTRLRLAAAAAALVHGMHPLRVESVAWATERRDVQSGLFLILTVLAYVKWAGPQGAAGAGRGRWLVLSLLCFAISLLSKAWGITLPAVLLILDLWPLKRLRPGKVTRVLFEKALYAGPALVAAGLAAWAQGEASARDTLADHTILERCVQACYGLFFYPWKTLIPTDLAALYWLDMELDPARAVHVLAYGVVAAITLTAWVLRRRFPAFLTAWLVFAIVVSPVLGFLQSGMQKVADRYSYLSCIPFALLYGGGLAYLAQKRERLLGPALAGTLVLTAVLGTMTWRQTLVWKDSEALYAHMVEVEPHNFFGWHNLAVQYHIQRRYDEAIEAELESIRFHPGKGNLPARINLVTLLRLAGRADEVPEIWGGILEADPTHLDSLRGLKAERLRAGDREGAIALVESSLEREPAFADGYAELADLRAAEGPRAVLEIWQRAVQAAPNSVRTKHGMGATLLRMNRDEEAGLWLEQAFGLDNNDVEVAIDFARVLGRTGRKDTALNLLTQVLGVSPNHPRAVAAKRALELGQRP